MIVRKALTQIQDNQQIDLNDNLSQHSLNFKQANQSIIKKKCRNGDQCQYNKTKSCNFIHSDTQASRLSLNQQLFNKSFSNISTQYKMCRFGDKCNKKSTCTFMHKQNQQLKSNISKKSISNSEIQQNKKPGYLKKKPDIICKNGKNCKYLLNNQCHFKHQEEHINQTQTRIPKQSHVKSETSSIQTQQLKRQYDFYKKKYKKAELKGKKFCQKIFQFMKKAKKEGYKGEKLKKFALQIFGEIQNNFLNLVQELFSLVPQKLKIILVVIIVIACKKDQIEQIGIYIVEELSQVIDEIKPILTQTFINAKQTFNYCFQKVKQVFNL